MAVQLKQSFPSRKEGPSCQEVVGFEIFHQRMEFRSSIGMPRTNFNVFVLFGLGSSMKRNRFRVVRLMENPILIVFGREAL
jgi:hypothetical protein